MAVEGLEVQPTDIVAADMFAAVLGCLLRQQLWLDAGCLDEQLLLAGAFERDEPERGIINAVLARSQQTVVLMQDTAVSADFAWTLTGRFLFRQPRPLPRPRSRPDCCKMRLHPG